MTFKPSSSNIPPLRPDGRPVLTPSHLIQYLYCPRFTYFEHVLRMPQYEEKYAKVMKGRELHLHRARTNADYLRKRIGVVEKRLDQYLANDWIRGIVDELLWLEDGTMAPLDYKFARWEGKVYQTYATQLACYAWLIEDNFGLRVPKGYLVYTRSKNKLQAVDLGEDTGREVREAARKVMRILMENRFPAATKHKKRCLECTYRNVCVQ